MNSFCQHCYLSESFPEKPTYRLRNIKFDIFGDIGGNQALDIVDLGELAVIVERDVGHLFLLGLLAKVLGVASKSTRLALACLSSR